MNKAHRLMELMERVKLKRSFTVQELADEFQVSYRTMLRDLEEISTMGIPIYSVPGRKGGFKLLERGKTDGKVEVISQPRRTFVGYSITAPYIAKSETEILVPRLWLKLLSVVDDIPGVKLPLAKTALGLYGNDSFEYYITVEVENDINRIPEGLTALSLQACHYARKTHIYGLELKKVVQTYEDIYSWAGQSGWIVLKEQYSLETYEEKFNPRSGNFDIYIPVKDRRK